MSAGARHHASWIKLASWRDSTEPGTGYRTSSLGQPGDFSATVRQSTSGGDWRNPQRSFDWRVSRQRTMREGPDENGRWWSGDYASGTEVGFGKAKSAATKALKEHWTTHIEAGGDVGYGDAPTGEQIRQVMAASHRQPTRARQQAAETGELSGLPGTREPFLPWAAPDMEARA